MFGPHILLLHDPSLLEKTRALCQREKLNIEAALEETIENLSSTFLRLEDPYFRERAADLQDIGKRLLDALVSSQPRGIPSPPEGSVIVTKELLPSVIAQLDRNRIRALVLETGEGQPPTPSSWHGLWASDASFMSRAPPGKSQPETC